ncbi:MAG: hypothetical protein ABL964_06500 [Steroidobacteraceae bacterium]
MFSHITIGSNDLEAAGRFYDAVLIPLGLCRRQVVPDGGPAALDVAYAAGMGVGGRDAGTPGPRQHYGDGYDGAYLFDPDGNKVHLAFRGDLEGRETGQPEHSSD